MPTRPRRVVRRLPAFALALAFAASLLAVVPAAAAVEGDEPGTAIPIVTSDFGSAQPYDTSAATTDPATDPASCETDFGPVDGPFTETFWHTFTPDADDELIVDVNSFPDPEAAGFLAVLFVFADDGAGGLDLVSCNAFPATVSFNATAGQVYYAMTGSLPETPGGGPAEITVLPRFVSGLVVDPTAAYDPQTDEVTITGSIDCSTAIDVFVSAFATQRIGSHVVYGDGGVDAACDGTTSWSVVTRGWSSFFNPGKIDVGVDVFACATVCLGDYVMATVRARPVSNKPGPVEPPPPAPANDEREGAFAIDLGGTAEQDVAGATSNETDPADCGTDSVSTIATVWYAVTTDSDGRVDLQTFASDYPNTIFVLDGDSVVACGEFAASFDATGGTTYLIMVGAWLEATPGHLVLQASEGAPPIPAPANDARSDAIPLVVDGPSESADTSGATVDLATDPQECPSAGFPPSEHTVWYAISPEADGWIEVNTFGSDYDTTLYVLDGSTVIACNDDSGSLQSRVTFAATAGATYEVMSGTYDGSPGGSLSIQALSTEEPPPPPEPLAVDVTVDPGGTVDSKTGQATVRGTIACSREASGGAFASGYQAGGRFPAIGSGDTGFECGPDPIAWSITLFPETSKFQNGSLDIVLDAFAATEDGQDSGTFFEGTITLRPARTAG